MKVNAIAIVAFAAASFLSLGFTYISNNTADHQLKAVTRVASQNHNLENTPGVLSTNLSGRANKNLASWD